MPTELQFSYGKWPSSGNGVDDIDILSNVESQYTFKIRRYSRMSRRPTNILCNDMIVASVDIVSTKEETISNNIQSVSNIKKISINNLQKGGNDNDVSSNTKMLGSISSSGGDRPYFSYNANVTFPLTSYKCTSGPGPEGPQIEVRNGNEDATDVCAIIRDISKPFDDKSTTRIVISDD